MVDGDSPGTGARRPQLTSPMRSSSYLDEHQQYRPPRQPENHYGIDTVVEDLGPRRPAFKGVPSAENPPKIIDSGLIHDLSHPNCVAAPGTSPPARLVATLFYRAARPRVSNAAAVRSSPPAAPSPTSDSDMPDNMAPTTDPEAFPLEPPVADPEPLDHLYGSYVSPLCVASFLHLMSTFPQAQSDAPITSAHRCLDNVEHPLVVELTLTPGPSPAFLSLADLRRHELLYRFEREWNVDVALQPDVLWRRYPRLVVFDMDSTLITQEVIDLLADAVPGALDVGALVAHITHQAMLGELEFADAFRQRVRLLAGLPASVLTDLRSRLQVTRGVRLLLRALKRLGVRTAVLSGGFLPLTAWLAAELGIDHAFANEVEISDDGRFTGEVQGTIVDKQRKRDLLLAIAAAEGIVPEQVVAVGAGANDLLMMEAAGLGVAWNAKPRVQMEAGARLNGESLLDLLYLFGLTRAEVDMLTAESGNGRLE